MLVFLHGGAFIGGERRKEGSPFHDTITLWAVKNGMVGVNMTYRLAPQFQWPAAQQDVRAALDWIRQNIAAFGGDPGRIVLVGHSSGAAHVAQYLSHPQFYIAPGSGVAGAVLFRACTTQPLPRRTRPCSPISVLILRSMRNVRRWRG